MRRFRRRTIWVGLVVFGLVAAALVFLLPREVHEAPSGTWALVSSEEVPETGKLPEGMLFAFEDGKFKSWTENDKKKPQKAVFHADPKKEPKEIDLIFENGDRKWIVPGIYRMTKSRLVLCFGAAKGDAPLNVGTRPTEFKAGKDIELLTLDRK